MTSNWLGEYLEGATSATSSPPRNPRRDRKSRWSAAPNQGDNSSIDELCVVGYSSKLYRDDERATEVNSVASLVPWMGDPTLQIDR